MFELEYGKWITKQLNAILQEVNKIYHLDLVCKRYDEVAHKPSIGDLNEVAVIIYGGNATRSGVRGIDYNILPLSVLVLCWEEHSVLIRNVVDAMQEIFNAEEIELEYFDNLKKEKVTTYVKSVFTTAFPIDEVDYSTDTETKKACYISFSATVKYGKTAIVQPPDASLLIDGKEYAIEHVSDYTFPVSPSYDTSLPKGSECPRQTKLSRSNTYSFTVSKTVGDPLQEIFKNEIRRMDGGLVGRTLKLKLDGTEIAIQTYDLTEAYTNGAAAYTLVLGV